MQRFAKRYGIWLAYGVFLAVAILFGSREPLIATDSPYALGKIVVLIVFAGFLAYSLHATRRENFFKSVGTINRLYWGRQIGLDLYVSVFLSLALIYLHEASFSVLLLWLVPVLFFANLAILPYILLNYGSIMSLFGG